MSDPTTPAAPPTGAPPAAEAPAATPPAAAALPPAAPYANPWMARAKEILRRGAPETPAAPAPTAEAKPAETPAVPPAAEPAAPAAPTPIDDAAIASKVREAIAPLAALALGELSDAQRAIVADLAGDDPQAQIRVIASLRKHAAPAAAKPAAIPPGATTAGPETALPSPASPAQLDTDVKAFRDYEALRATSPHLATRLFMNNAAAISRGRVKASASPN